ncbi:epimerase [Saccharopolyspora erythraea]|uniref:NAD-dependent epimerase/dehydratase family protein n=1 Tax=Saccharopolyspora erythraea TaxID=1836 RepID=UPI001BAADF20|nr:NAD-dependent epimerase/dehydratase family protein [Saccharopolyspora erythraea]QUH05462.1 epimerase [Saccharopolyspora erythraea]
MRLLVLGGTEFLSYAVAADAVRRGHEVVCAARGVTGPVPEGARLVKVDRDAPGSVDVLAGERFDAVVDVAKMSYPWVRDALAAVGSTAGHWTFVSTVNVYAETATATGELLEPLTEPPAEIPDDQLAGVYGAIKVASENAVRDTVGDRAFIVRPGLITGARDATDRFGYWAARFARGGRVLVPDEPAQPIQHIDVVALAKWIVDSAEQRTTGTFDATGPVLELGSLLREVAVLVAPEDTELAAVAPADLAEAGVNPWSGPKSLPFWAPKTHYGVVTRDGSAAWGAGLGIRPLVGTVQDALDTERRLGTDRERKAGLTRGEEAALLADLPQRAW